MTVWLKGWALTIGLVGNGSSESKFPTSGDWHSLPHPVAQSNLMILSGKTIGSLVVNKCILGIDPGASGAIAFYFTQYPENIAAFDVPLVDGDIDCAQLAAIIENYNPDIAIIEMVGAMPKQGVSSTFKFGMSFGMARGVVGALKIRQHYVTPAKWKKHFGLIAEKEKARERAIQLWPKSDAFRRKKDHGRAEAALLCKYGAEVLKF